MKTTSTVLLAMSFFTILSCHENKIDQSEKNRNLASLYFTQIHNEENLDLISEIFTEDYQHVSTGGQTRIGQESMKEAITNIHNMLPGLEMNIIESVADDEKVIFIIEMDAEMPSFAFEDVRDNKIKLTETFIFWIKDNKIYKGRSIGTHFELLKQLTGFEGGLMEGFDAISNYQKSREDKIKITSDNQ